MVVIEEHWAGQDRHLDKPQISSTLQLYLTNIHAFNNATILELESIQEVEK